MLKKPTSLKAAYSNSTADFRQALTQKYTIAQEVCANFDKNDFGAYVQAMLKSI
ncbi:hypothetical protein [Moraxella canis]|uniref:hypothetical protein n=1 Tax=Moraxella canis TaxID=90239 RepID=UPI00178CE772|nr:hypothetical protein [Moraxella canis]